MSEQQLDRAWTKMNEAAERRDAIRAAEQRVIEAAIDTDIAREGRVVPELLDYKILKEHEAVAALLALRAEVAPMTYQEPTVGRERVLGVIDEEIDRQRERRNAFAADGKAEAMSQAAFAWAVLSDIRKKISEIKQL